MPTRANDGRIKQQQAINVKPRETPVSGWTLWGGIRLCDMSRLFLGNPWEVRSGPALLAVPACVPTEGHQYTIGSSQTLELFHFIPLHKSAPFSKLVESQNHVAFCLSLHVAFPRFSCLILTRCFLGAGGRPAAPFAFIAELAAGPRGDVASWRQRKGGNIFSPGSLTYCVVWDKPCNLSVTLFTSLHTNEHSIYLIRG